MHENNYIFVSAHDSFGLYIDPTNSIEIIEKFEEIVKQYSHLRISGRDQSIHELPHVCNPFILFITNKHIPFDFYNIYSTFVLTPSNHITHYLPPRTKIYTQVHRIKLLL